VYNSRLRKYYCRNTTDRNVSKRNLFALLLFSCAFVLREQEGYVKISEDVSKTLYCDGGGRRIVSESAIVDRILNINVETHRRDNKKRNLTNPLRDFEQCLYL